MKKYEVVEAICTIGQKTNWNVKTFTNYKKAKEEFNIRINSHKDMKEGYKSKDFGSFYNDSNCTITIAINEIKINN